MMQGKESDSVEESSEEQSLEGSSKSDENTSSNEHHMDYLNNIEIIKDHLRSQEEHKNKGNFIKSVIEALIFMPPLSHYQISIIDYQPEKLFQELQRRRNLINHPTVRLK